MTNEERKVIELALEALEDIKDDCSGCEFEWSNDYPLQAKAHTAIKEALAQPEQEPVAWIYESVCGNDFSTCNDPPSYAKNIRPLYTTPPQPEKLDQDEVDIRSRLYQRIYELECLLKDIAEYTGEGPPTTDWQGIVKLISDSARNALEDKEMIKE